MHACITDTRATRLKPAAARQTTPAVPPGPKTWASVTSTLQRGDILIGRLQGNAA